MKKILSLLTLLLCVCSGAWAELPLSYLSGATTFNKSYAWGSDYAKNKVQYNSDNTIMMWSNGNALNVSSDGKLNSDTGLAIGNSSKKSAFVFCIEETSDLSIGIARNGSDMTASLYYLGTTTETLTDPDKMSPTGALSSVEISSSSTSGTLTKSNAAAGYYMVFGTLRFITSSITVETSTPATAPTISTQPQSASYNIGDTPADLTVSATASTGELSYQWKSCTAADKTGAANISGATTATLSASNFPTTSEATYYFYCTVTDGQGSTDTNVATITVTETKSASDLAVSSGKGTINTTVGASNYTLASGTDFTTSSDGTLSFASSIPGVAYVDAATGELQFLGAGTTTITLTQAEGSAYEGGSVTFTVNVLPAACLNLGDKDAAIAQLKNGWLFDSPYFDTENKQVIIGVYAAYQTANGGFQPWIGTAKSTDKLSAEELADPANYKVGGTSTKVSWSASAPFIGSTGYYTDDASRSNIRSANSNSSRPWSVYKFRVKGITAAQAYVQGKNGGNNAERRVTISAFEITDGALAAEAAKSAGSAGNADEVISVSELDSNKEYLIVLGNTEYASNLNVYEIAFTASASGIEIPSNRITTSAAGWASYTPMYKVSGTIYKPSADKSIANMTVYAVSAVDGSEATMSEVTVGMAPNNGYFLKGDANTTYRTTATTGSPAAPATNLIKAQTETGTVKSEGDYTRYALLTYDAENYGLYKLNSTGVTIPAGKAYLEVPVVAARAFDFLNFNFDGETTGINKVVPAEAVKDGVQKFYENGKLVIMRNGVKYNVAGAQVK